MSGNSEKRRVGRPRTVDRQGSIQLAMDAYWREGVHTLSLNEVCRRAKLSKPTLYREFGGEDGLMDAVLGHYRTLIVLPMLQALEMALPFGELAEALVDGMTAESENPAGCLFTEMRLARTRLGPKTQGKLRDLEQERLGALEAWYRRALDQGQVDPSIPPSLAAQYIDTQLAAVLLQLGAGVAGAEVRAQAILALGALKAKY